MKENLDGAVLSGRYELKDVVGRGGMGSVFRALDGVSGEEVAVKVLLDGNHKGRERFSREIEMSCALRHEHLGRARAAGYDEALGLPFLVMDLMKGLDLGRFLREHGRLSPAAAVSLVLQVLEGLKCLHKEGIWHRDIKPANIFLEEQGAEVRAVLCDLGIAKPVENGGDHRMLTSEEAYVGSVMYMPPEYVRSKSFDARSDLYALSASLYEAVGQVLWSGQRSTPEIMAAIMRDDISPLWHVAPWVDRALAQKIHRGLSRQPEERFSCCEEMIEALYEHRCQRWPVPLLQMVLRDEERGAVQAVVENTPFGGDTAPVLQAQPARRIIARAAAGGLVALIVLGGLSLPRGASEREAPAVAVVRVPEESTPPAESTAEAKQAGQGQGESGTEPARGTPVPSGSASSAAPVESKKLGPQAARLPAARPGKGPLAPASSAPPSPPAPAKKVNIYGKDDFHE